MTDTVNMLNSDVAAVQQPAQMHGANEYNRAMKRVFDMMAAFNARGVKLSGFGSDNTKN